MTEKEIIAINNLIKYLQQQAVNIPVNTINQFCNELAELTKLDEQGATKDTPSESKE